MSAALVPGCILLLALASRTLCSMVGSRLEKLPRAGDLGPIWISVGGGGLGSLGELGGRDISMVEESKLPALSPGHTRQELARLKPPRSTRENPALKMTRLLTRLCVIVSTTLLTTFFKKKDRTLDL